MRIRVFVLVMLVSVVLAGCIVEPTPTATVSPLPTVSPLVAGPAGETFDFMETLQAVLDWIVANYDVVALVAALAASFAHDGWGRVKAFAVSLMLEAEKMAKAEIVAGGPEKMAAVVSGVVANLPPGIKQVLVAYAAIQGKTVDRLVQDLCQRWYDAAVNAG